ncbi:hypothetical protein CVT30_31910 [Streptomyces sp. AMCC400023]|nr:hypothetical protein CVT30_31910 [Streptomyces sp. AMCC400023]
MSAMEHVLRELYAVQRLAIESGDSAGAPQVREYLVRRAAVLDRLVDDAAGHWDPAEADRYAKALIGHDLLHDSARGPIPAGAPCWRDVPRGYARQEHRAWVLEHEVP